jgi:hypothetical protein
MSEASNVWQVEVGARAHQVEVEHSTFTGKIVVKVDGVAVDEDRLLLSKREMSFDLEGHRVVVGVEFTHGGFASRSTLHLDGRYVEPMLR